MEKVNWFKKLFGVVDHNFVNEKEAQEKVLTLRDCPDEVKVEFINELIQQVDKDKMLFEADMTRVGAFNQMTNIGEKLFKPRTTIYDYNQEYKELLPKLIESINAFQQKQEIYRKMKKEMKPKYRPN